MSNIKEYTFPVYWNVSKLDKLSTKITDGSHFSPVPQETGWIIANVKDMGEWGINYDSCTKIKEEDFNLLVKQNCSPQPFDILLSKDGTIGRVVLFRGDKNIVLLSSIAIIRSNGRINPDYLNHILRSFIFEKQLFSLQSGSALKRIVLRDITNLLIPYPNKLPHQRKIARILTTADNIIEKTEAVIAKYKAIKQGMVHDLFTRGIDVKTGKLRPAFEDAPELYKESELGTIPNEWDVEIIENVASITTGSKDTQDRFAEGIYPFIVRSQTIERINSYSFDGEAILTAGDGVGTGKVFHYLNTRFDFHQRVYMLYDFSKDMVGKYLFHFFKQNFIKEVDKYSAKTTVDSVRYHMISEMNIPKPSKKEQAMVLGTLDSIDNKLVIEKDFLHKIKKQGLMQDLLTGKKEVTPDPEDFDGVRHV